MPRHLMNMDDGSVWRAGTNPKVIIRHEDNAVFTVVGILRGDGRCWLAGGFEHESGKFDVGPEKVGDDWFDPSDLSPDAILGHTIVFQDFTSEILPKVQGRVVSHRIMQKEEVPKDKTFKFAWRDGGNAVTVDMPTARNVWRNRMRKVRAAKLAALDAEYMRADEDGDVKSKKDIAAKKQVLRDVTSDPAIESAQTPEALKAVWPAALG